MPWLKYGNIWYEVPPGLDPLDGEEIEYGEPPEDDERSTLAAAIALGLLSWAWDGGEAHYLLCVEGELAYVLNYAGLDFYALESVKASSAATDFLASFLADGTLPADSWRELMRQEIKEEYIRQMALARGGYAQLTQADYEALGSMLKEQYKYLDNFYQEIMDGKLSEAQIRARAEMYINSTGQAFERGKEEAAKEAGLNLIKWTLTPAENCDGCIEFSDMGWQRVEDDPYSGCVPKSGCTPCIINCKCFLAYARNGEG